jgi:glycosyltransferase involved in cell wall biosynthesis
MSAARVRVVVLSPRLEAISGMTTHAKMLMSSSLSRDFDLFHFPVGSEGLNEGLGHKAWRLTSTPFRLATFLVRQQADVVHVNTSLERKAYWRDLVYIGVAKVLRKRVVNEIHGGALPQEFFAGSRIFTDLLRRVLVASDVVAVLSRREFAAYQSFDSRINVHLVPNAIESVGLLDGKRSYNTTGPLRFVYVGRTVRSKGLFDMVEALRRVKSSGIGFSLSLAGDGVDQSELKVAVAAAGLVNEVQFLGSVVGEAKIRLWLESDVLVLPSHGEGLPYSLLEGMAAGCVPVTTAVGAISDVIADGRHGLFVPVRDPAALAAALASLHRDRDSLVRMAKLARTRIAENFTITRLADDFRSLYRAAV